MEWAIFISVVLLYTGKFVLTADAFLKGSEPHLTSERTRRRTRPVTGHLPGETSINGFARGELNYIIQNLQQRHQTREMPRSEEQSSKVDWKREGF